MTSCNEILVKGPPAILSMDNLNSCIMPPMPSNAYGKDKETVKQDDYYLSSLVDKPPIEYIAEFLCNIFIYKTDKVSGEHYFHDGMGRTFFETINNMFSSKSNYDKIYELNKKFSSRSRNKNGDFAVFASNNVSEHEMREFILFFYDYFQKNDDVFFNYLTFHYFYRNKKNKPVPDVLKEFIRK